MSSKYIFSLILSILFIYSCGDAVDMNDDDPVNPIATEVTGVDYLVTLSQELEGPNRFQVFVQNKEAIDCIESVELNWTDTENGLVLDLISTALPDCNHDTISIIEEVDISALADELGIIVKIEEIENEVKVEKTAESFGLKFRSADRIDFEEDRILLIPENVAWGYSNLTTTESRDIEKEFYRFEGFPDAINFATNLEEGYYGYFTIGDLGAINGINSESNYGQSMFLNLENNNSWDNLKNLLSGMEEGFPNFKYHFQNAEGTIIESL